MALYFIAELKKYQPNHHVIDYFFPACARPEDIANGETIWEDVLTAAVVIYVCDPGYEIIGDEQRSCLVTGLWSGNKPTCRSKSYIPYREKIFIGL